MTSCWGHTYLEICQQRLERTSQAALIFEEPRIQPMSVREKRASTCNRNIWKLIQTEQPAPNLRLCPQMQPSKQISRTPIALPIVHYSILRRESLQNGLIEGSLIDTRALFFSRGAQECFPIENCWWSHVTKNTAPSGWLTLLANNPGHSDQCTPFSHLRNQLLHAVAKWVGSWIT